MNKPDKNIEFANCLAAVGITVADRECVNRDQVARDFMLLPARQWQAALSVFTPEEHMRLADCLNGLAEKSALAAGYVNGQTTEINHARGVKRANRLCTAIRRAIGFAYPKSTLSF